MSVNNDIDTFGIFILRYVVIVTFAIFRARKIFIAESSQTLSKTSLTVNLLITGQQLKDTLKKHLKIHSWKNQDDRQR